MCAERRSGKLNSKDENVNVDANVHPIHRFVRLALVLVLVCALALAETHRGASWRSGDKLSNVEWRPRPPSGRSLVSSPRESPRRGHVIMSASPAPTPAPRIKLQRSHPCLSLNPLHVGSRSESISLSYVCIRAGSLTT